jgi:hypothetical protein
MKIAIYAIAVERRECYGHGEYGNLLSIEQQGAYGPGPAFFHPVFLSKKKAEDYCNLLDSFKKARIIALELEIDSALIDIDITEIIEDESKNKWKAAVIDYLVCRFLLNKENEGDPRRAIHDIIGWEVQAALDPSVSEGARKLLEMRPEDYKNS